MTIRKFICLAGLAFLLTPGSARIEQADTRLNVVFIVIDDLRRDLGTYGSPVVKSPNIDKLASEGVRFDNAYCQYPVCNPSRTSFLTGLRPDSTRILDNSTKFRTTIPDVVTLPQLFREQGYFTASLGKIFHRGLTMEDLRPEMDDQKSWDVSRYFQATEAGLRGEGRNMTGGKLAWCHWLAAEGEDEDQPDGMIARDAIRILEEQSNKNQPFFLALGFHKPHDPFIAPKKYFGLYPLEKLTLTRVASPFQSDPAPALPGGAFRESFEKFTDRERREFMRSYYAGTSFTDAQIGKVITALERLKLREKTIIIVLGDHGYHLGERGWWNKNTLFELSARAPVIVSTPQGRARGRSSSRLIEFIDFYPTLVELCSLPAPAHLQGRSIVPLLDDPKLAWKEAAYTQVRRGRIDGYSVRTERWRYTEWDSGRAGAELYDHRNDPQELHNLAGDPKMAGTVAEMKRLLGRIR